MLEVANHIFQPFYQKPLFSMKTVNSFLKEKIHSLFLQKKNWCLINTDGYKSSENRHTEKNKEINTEQHMK